MLNAPSTKSRFAKPIKDCFIAPEGYVVGAIDFSALEDRGIANLSRDPNKIGLFLDGLDGHSLSTSYYWPEKVRNLVGDFETNAEAARKLQALVDSKDKLAKAIRDASKNITFGLSYGCYPPKVAATAKVSIEEAQEIYDAYHNELYPGITKYREEYVLKTAEEQGYIHLGLGFRLYTDNAKSDIRTLNNATCQFWSILTVLTINKLHQLIDKAGLTEDIKVTSTIYDSIYFIVKDDPKVIKWLNDRIIPIMEQDFMVDQIVKNSVDFEIGPSWSTLYKLSHNASIEEISEILEKCKS